MSINADMAKEISGTDQTTINGYAQWKRLQYRRKISWDCVKYKQISPPCLALSLAKALSMNTSRTESKACPSCLPNLKKVGKSRVLLRKRPVTSPIVSPAAQETFRISSNDLCPKHLPLLEIKLVRVDAENLEPRMRVERSKIKSKGTETQMIAFMNDPTRYHAFLEKFARDPTFEQNAIMKAIEVVSDLGMTRKAACTLIQSYQSKIRDDLNKLSDRIIPTAPPPVVSSTNTIDEIPTATDLLPSSSTSQAAVALTVETGTETNTDCTPHAREREKLGNEKIVELLTSHLEITTKTMQQLTELLAAKKNKKKKKKEKGKMNKSLKPIRNMNASWPKPVSQKLSGNAVKETKGEFLLIDLTHDNDLKTDPADECQTDFSVNRIRGLICLYACQSSIESKETDEQKTPFPGISQPDQIDDINHASNVERTSLQASSPRNSSSMPAEPVPELRRSIELTLNDVFSPIFGVMPNTSMTSSDFNMTPLLAQDSSYPCTIPGNLQEMNLGI